MVGSALIAAAVRRKQRTPNNYTVSSSNTPEPTLNLIDLILLGVGGMLGSGLFLLTGRAARYTAGPAISVSFALGGVACLFTALCYAEMSSRLPNSGGAYAFSYAALGELPAFLVGMCLTLEYGVSSAAVARAWASYLGDAIPVFPSWAIASNSTFSVLGFALIVALSILLSFGLHQAKWVINIATILYAIVVFIIVGFGSRHIDMENWDPFFPFGFTGVISGTSAVFFSFVGFDEVATVSEEAFNAARNVPVAILISMVVVTGMYITASLVLTGTVNYLSIDVDAPFSAAMRAIDLPIVAKLVGFGTALGMMNTALVGFAAQPRVFISMGRDGLLPRAMAFSTSFTTLGCGAIVAVLALVVDTQQLADVVSGGTLLAFLATNMCVLLTRARIHSRSRREPVLVYAFVFCCSLTAISFRISEGGSWIHYIPVLISMVGLFALSILLFQVDFSGGEGNERDPPAFTCPLVPAVPIAGAFTTCFLLFQLHRSGFTALLVWLLLSSGSYFLYGAKNAIIANEYNTLLNASPSQSHNSFDELALEANSVSEDSDKEHWDTVQPKPAPDRLSSEGAGIAANADGEVATT